MAKKKSTSNKKTSVPTHLFPVRNYMLLIGALVLLVIAPYMIRFYGHPWSDDPADWGVLGDYFGGVLNPVIALITLFVTIRIAVRLNEIERRNHNESINSQVKPLLTIQQAIFFSADVSRMGLTATDFYSYEEPIHPINQFSHLHHEPFYVKLFNIGLGIAKDVKFEFEIDILECKEAIDFNDSRVNLSVNEGLGALNWKIDTRETGGAKIENVSRKFVGIVNNQKDIGINVPVPDSIMKAFQLFNLRRKLSATDRVFPTIYVTVYYKNIHDLELEVKYKLGLFSVKDYSKYSVYRLLTEQIITTNS